MPKNLFKALKKPGPLFFDYLLKTFLAFAFWFVLFALIYLNTQFNLPNQNDNFLYLLGAGLLLAILILSSGLYLMFFNYPTFSRNKNIFLIVLASFLAVLILEICLVVPLNLYILPMPGIAILLALLLDSSVSFLTTLILSLIFGFMTQGHMGFFIMMFLGSALGAILAANTRKRNQILNTGILVGLLNFCVITIFGFYKGHSGMPVFQDALWGLGGGIFSSFFVMGLLHLFEMLFGITTNITLLELSDLNNPILKDLILKAPGTYHHSLIVGNLAEAACDAISANSLLARVGAYYHDIGKIEKAEYFSENEIEAKSRHEALTPTMSALIIINHVKDGIEVARKHNLPASILDFITQHHGTGLIYFFYQRALEKNGDESFLKEEDFRYPGPKPQTKEAAVVLLADAVEASSRTLSDPTPARIQALTQRIINNKFIDGQLDECDLSLKDLNKIAMSFARILTGIFHSRVEYPAVSSSTA